MAAIDPNLYAGTRNHLEGAVTGLSPYITHGYVSLPRVHELIERQTGRALGPQDKLFAEFGWREFFHHVWRYAADGILSDMRPGLAGVRYAGGVPQDVREARTGVPVIDEAVRTLYRTGYLHNHARLWLSSYLVHWRKVAWRSGADWMYGHLLDGDLASNHLSWQWVAGTFSAKPYLFNAENVARFAPRRWHSGQTEVDHGYELLEALAHRNGQLPARASPRRPGPVPEPIGEPPLWAVPPESMFNIRDQQYAHAPLGGSEPQEWVHPWALAERSSATLRLGVLHAEFHRLFPWSEVRWRFVLTRMRAVCDAIVWIDPQAAQPPALSSMPGIMQTSLAPGYRDLEHREGVQVIPAPRLLPDPGRPCRSFSAFYKDATARWVSTRTR